MNALTTTSRLLLGITFAAAGAMPFLLKTPPAQPGLAGQFNTILFQSHWALFVGAAQLAIGILLIFNRFVPLAIVMLAAFLYNSFAFHITIAPAALGAPVIVSILGYIVGRPHGAAFAALLSRAPAR